MAASEGAGPGRAATYPQDCQSHTLPHTHLGQVSSKTSGTKERGPLSFLMNFPHPSEAQNHSSFVSLGLLCSWEKAEDSVQTLISCRKVRACVLRGLLERKQQREIKEDKDGKGAEEKSRACDRG